MADHTNIEWCDATFNPWIGCTKVSTAANGGGGCDNCYAAAQDKFRRWTPEGWGGPRKRTSTANWRKPVQWNDAPFYECRECGWRGETDSNCPSCAAEVRTARRRVFCASLADVFDNQVPEGWRVDLFRLIRNTPNLDWLLLTKRIGNAVSMIEDSLMHISGIPEDVPAWPWPNVWLGATVVNQEEADRDIPKLLATPARVRFLSCEPLLGPLDLTRPYLEAKLGRYPFPKLEAEHRTTLLELLDWVITGGESGRGARPMHPDWARSLRDQCAAAGVEFLFKQWGEHVFDESAAGSVEAPVHFEHKGTFRRVGKKTAGRELDGVTHDGMPTP